MGRWQGGMLTFDSRTRDKVMENNDWAVQLAFFVAVSVAAGLLGASFNIMRGSAIPPAMPCTAD